MICCQLLLCLRKRRPWSRVDHYTPRGFAGRSAHACRVESDSIFHADRTPHRVERVRNDSGEAPAARIVSPNGQGLSLPLHTAPADTCCAPAPVSAPATTYVVTMVVVTVRL